MTNYAEERVRLGDGHQTWLRNKGIPLRAIESIGRAWETISKDSNSPKLVEAVDQYMRTGLDVITNKEFCLELKKWFEGNHVSPLAIDVSGPWNWIGQQILGIAVGQSYLMGKEPLKGDIIRKMQDIGSTNAHIGYSQYNAWHHGSQTFDISLALATKLFLTDIEWITWGDFHLPFPSFVIRVPPVLANLCDERTGKHDLDTIIVTEHALRGNRRVEFLFCGRENENSEDIGDDSNFFEALHSDDPEKPVQDSIGEHGVIDTHQELANCAGKSGEEATRRLICWTVAMIAYLTDFPSDCVKRDTEALEKKVAETTGKAKKNARKRLKDALKDNTYRVGSKIVLDPMLTKIASAIGRGEALPPSVASYVRGHRKMQPHGPGRSLRKPIWVDPYWRNLHNETITSKTYEVR